MKYFKQWQLYVITLFVYFCVVSVLRIIQKGIFGAQDWDVVMFRSINFPLLDWWKLLVPSFVFSFLLVWLVPRLGKKIILFLIGLITLVFIISSYGYF